MSYYLASVNGGGGVGLVLGLHLACARVLGFDQFKADLHVEHLAGCVTHSEIKLVALVNLAHFGGHGARD